MRKTPENERKILAVAGRLLDKAILAEEIKIGEIDGMEPEMARMFAEMRDELRVNRRALKMAKALVLNARTNLVEAK